MSDYRVELDCYTGPLDLLLYLVRRHEIDLHDIPIAQLTEQYFQHLKLIEQVNVEQAADFLVMAATLLEIKSAMLLPQQPSQPGDDPQTSDPAGAAASLDPRYELVQQLLQYKKFKDAAQALDLRRRHWQDRFPCQPLCDSLNPSRPPDVETAGHDPDTTTRPADLDLEDVSVLDLCEAFARILETVGRGPGFHEVVLDDTPIALHAVDILDRLGRDGPMTLAQIIAGRTRRVELIGLFLAALELVRQRKIRVLQDQIGSDIHLELSPESEPPTPDPLTVVPVADASPATL